MMTQTHHLLPTLENTPLASLDTAALCRLEGGAFGPGIEPNPSPAPRAQRLNFWRFEFHSGNFNVLRPFSRRVGRAR